MAVSSRQKGQNERRHDHLSSCVYLVEVLGDGCQHWNEVVEQRIDMKDIREISGSRGVNRTETEAGNFVRDTSLDRQPVELSEYLCGMCTRGSTNYKTRAKCTG